MVNGYIPTCKKKTDKLCAVEDYDFVNINPGDPGFGKS